MNSRYARCLLVAVLGVLVGFAMDTAGIHSTIAQIVFLALLCASFFAAARSKKSDRP